MSDPREVTIFIGRKSYRIATALDKPVFDRVAAVVREVSASLKDNIDQDQLLMLTCLRLAYGLEKATGKLAPLMDVLEDVEPWRPAPSPKDGGRPQ